MYKNIFSIVLIAMMAGQVHADTVRGNVTLNGGKYDEYDVRGSADINGATFQSLDVSGRLKAENITVKNRLLVRGNTNLKKVTVEDIVINGRLKADTLKAQSLEVRGNCSLNNATITATTYVFGHLKAENSSLRGVASVCGTETTFNNCRLCSLKIPAQNGFSSLWSWVKSWFVSDSKNIVAQNVYLKGKSIVSGGITFEGGRGTVYISSQAKITGAVTGGVTKRL